MTASYGLGELHFVLGPAVTSRYITHYVDAHTDTSRFNRARIRAAL